MASVHLLLLALAFTACHINAVDAACCKQNNECAEIKEGTADCIVFIADQDNDLRLSTEEARAYLKYYRNIISTSEDIDVELKKLDINNDGYLTAEEIDPPRPQVHNRIYRE